MTNEKEFIESVSRCAARQESPSQTIISARILTAHQTSESVSVRSIRDGRNKHETD